MTRTTGVVLAGGGSRRMGMDKRGLRLFPGSPTFLERSVAIAKLTARRVAIVGDGEISIAGVEVVGDRSSGSGPLAGLVDAFDAFPGHLLIVLACDYPLLQLSTVQAVAAEIGDRDAAMAVGEDGRDHPLVGVYQGQRCVEAARGVLAAGGRSMRALLDQIDVVRVPVWMTQDPARASLSLSNVNSREELDALRELTLRVDREVT